MNNVAISNHLLVNLLQIQNVKRETVNKREFDKSANTIKSPNVESSTDESSKVES